MKFVGILIAMASFFGLGNAAAQDQDEKIVYELRTYTTHPGRIDALNDFFENHTIKIFNKYGMESIGYWVPVDTPDTLIYIIRHKSMKSAQTSWEQFIKDPDRIKAGEEAMKDGPIVLGTPKSVYMYATDYSLNFLNIKR